MSDELISMYIDDELSLDDIVRAENCTLFDSRGNQYVDLESGVWCTSVGHANPRVRQRAADARELATAVSVGIGTPGRRPSRPRRCSRPRR